MQKHERDDKRWKKDMLGNPQLTVTPLEQIKEGTNHIVVDSVQYGNQEMIMEKIDQ